MLQQTRVETVIPYYERFLARFPTVASLAAADVDEVLPLWSGLGYYRRARSLHLAAREVTTKWGGALPSTAAELRTLPGVGRYTAGAIASIAFSEATPVVDGNVARVLARVFCVEDDITRGPAQRELWRLAGQLVDKRDPGALNQALMELGATVCTPRAPRCGDCPVLAHCAARNEGRTEELPNKARAKAPRPLALATVVAKHDGVVWLGKRVHDGLFGGLWEPPMAPGSLAEARPQLAGLGIPKRAKTTEVGTVRHVLTHRALSVAVAVAAPRRRYRSRGEPGGGYTELSWRTPGQVALSTLARKVLAAAGALVLALVIGGGTARAEPEKKAKPPVTDVDAPVTKDDLKRYKRLDREGGIYARVFATAAAGKGLRFNNPFRLQDQLGDNAESLSLTSAYLDFSLNAAFGEPNGLQHGGAIHLSLGLEGVPQQALSVSYLAVYRADSPAMLYGRLGASFLTAPDPNVGGEAALGFSYFFTGSLGLTSELVGNLYYGAGTYEVEITTIPVLSLQLGVIGDFEVLP